MTLRQMLAVLATTLAAAAPLAHGQNAQQVCAGDIATYCQGVQQGEGRLARCLRANEAKLSAACRQGMQKTAALMKEVVMACEDDLHRFCAGAAPGTAKECLRANFRELSLPCRRELFEAKKSM